MKLIVIKYIFIDIFQFIRYKEREIEMKKIVILNMLVVMLLCINSIKIKADNLENNKFIEYSELSTLNENECINVTIRLNYEESNNFYNSNMSIIQNLNVLDLNFEISELTPFLFKSYLTYELYLSDRSTLINISLDNDIQYIVVEKIDLSNYSNSESDEGSNDSISIDEVKNMMNITNNTFTGNNIKIGVIEFLKINNTLNFDTNDIVDEFLYDGINEGSHAAKVCSLIGGNSGLATNAELYMAYLDIASTSTRLDLIMKWLVICMQVDIINISIEMGLASVYGYYNGYAAYLDFIACEYNVCIIKSAGNYSPNNDNQYITTPGCAFNIITVGAMGNDGSILDRSCYNISPSLSNIIKKPNVVAPGDSINIPNLGGESNESHSGTSLSAALVTGMVALLMEEFPILKDNLSLLMSAIMNGADPISNNSIWNLKSGAGLVNYEKTREIIGNFITNNENNNFNNIDNIVYQKSLTIPAYHKVEFCVTNNMQIYSEDLLEVNNSIIGNPNNLYNTYKVCIYNQNNELLCSYTTNNNVILADFCNDEENDINVILKIEKNNVINASFEDKLSITYQLGEHDHIYDFRYLQYNNNGHKAYCVCGNYLIRPHVILSPQPNQRFVMCIKCNYLLDLQDDYVAVLSNNKIAYTKNGSYILENGLVVLVNEDLEKYFNNELIFNNNNLNSERS